MEHRGVVRVVISGVQSESRVLYGAGPLIGTSHLDHRSARAETDTIDLASVESWGRGDPIESCPLRLLHRTKMIGFLFDRKGQLVA